MLGTDADDRNEVFARARKDDTERLDLIDARVG
jgi:hypothetical protein